MKILMVCLGNICRSPLAHGVMQHLVDEEGLFWKVDSAGTGDWHAGQQPDKRSIQIAKNYGVDISNQRAQHFESTLFDQYDHILTMDHQNYANVVSLAKNEVDQSKVSMFLKDGEVPDPYYDNNMFDPVYRMIESRCREIIDEWK